MKWIKEGRKEGKKKGEGIKEASSIGNRLHPTELLTKGVTWKSNQPNLL